MSRQKCKEKQDEKESVEESKTGKKFETKLSRLLFILSWHMRFQDFKDM